MGERSDVLENLPVGLVYDEEIGLSSRGVVARQVADHLVVQRPDRPFSTCTLDHMSDNSTLGMHLARIEPQGTKCGHRHLDETMAFIVSGRGHTEYRQDDSKQLTRLDWEAGDLLVIPCNAWHEHFNDNGDDYTRQLSFRNTRLINRLLIRTDVVYSSKGATYRQLSRFPDRYDDEPDYFQRRETLPDGSIKTNYVRQLVAEPLPAADPSHGEGVAVQRYVLGGQVGLGVALVGIASGGRVRPHQPLSEEGLLILRGTGRTDFWTDDGVTASVEWRAGDVISVPLGTWRQHVATADVRALHVRDMTIPLALGLADTTWFDTTTIRRFPTLLEPATD